MNFIYAQHPRHEFGDTLLHIARDDLVYLCAQLVCDLSLARPRNLVHNRHDVFPALRLRVRGIEIVQRHVLNNFLFLVNISLRQRHVLLSFQIKLGGVRVRASYALDSARIGLDVDHVPHRHAFPHEEFVHGWLHLELLASLCRFQRHHHALNTLPEPTERVHGLLGAELRHLALVHFLRLLHAKTDCASKRFHEHFCFLYLCRVNLSAGNYAERNASSKFHRDSMRDRCLSGARRSNH
mmetsp:Transcript_15203/g.40807  ORF Transcript_15203/g.40807 Transcript_15203/m.40807 type:complete len:239 (+) Transcript_15203:977-1693(+)